MTNDDNQESKLSRWWLLLEVIIFVAFLAVLTTSSQCSCQSHVEYRER